MFVSVAENDSNSPVIQNRWCMVYRHRFDSIGWTYLARFPKIEMSSEIVMLNRNVLRVLAGNVFVVKLFFYKFFYKLTSHSTTGVFCCVLLFLSTFLKILSNPVFVSMHKWPNFWSWTRIASSENLSIYPTFIQRTFGRFVDLHTSLMVVIPDSFNLLVFFPNLYKMVHFLYIIDELHSCVSHRGLLSF